MTSLSAAGRSRGRCCRCEAGGVGEVSRELIRPIVVSAPLDRGLGRRPELLFLPKESPGPPRSVNRQQLPVNCPLRAIRPQRQLMVK